MRHFGFLASLCLTSSIALIATSASAAPDASSSNVGYFTIAETGSANLTSDFMQMSFDTVTEAVAAASKDLDTLHWVKHDAVLAAPKEDYQRLAHFGTWVNTKRDETCYNTRSLVMIRDSAVHVTNSPTNHCIVSEGRWFDPYTGNTYTKSDEIQIDHVVPLKHAYLSGAWKWNFKNRCAYANFMGNSFHLLSVQASANMRKGDRAPDAYMPPRRAYQCEYLANWLKIKLIWKLTLSNSEASAIAKQIDENGCTEDDFSFSKKDLKLQRNKILDRMIDCPDREAAKPSPAA